MTTTLYGISNCDTIKKAKKWLETNNINYQFHDFRKDGLSRQWLEQTEAKLGWETLLNKRGTTYRQLDEQTKTNMTRDTALDIMADSPAIIKRPVLSHNASLYVGFKSDDYEEIFNHE
ncbi:ArsC family reductase [Salinimonas sp. HHU 13199]|uniref:ArsC family reductase n=1 Tax=Salinimonas profundi TaxID=2729140 RepID=A0ABR8LF87_9ALTE|nr:ArsC family reductase [Salinimonas profundi]MBD3584924.1 ArsC family reductase [Salinimonas profundi]